MTFFIRRDTLMRVFGDERDARQFEVLQQTVSETSEASTAGLAATQKWSEATFVTLSPNAELSGEKVLVLGDGLTFAPSPDGQVKISARVRTSGGWGVTLATTGETNVAIPPAGFLATREWVNDKEWASIRFIPGTAPASPVAGLTYYDSGTNKLRTYDGTAWQDHW